MDAHREILDERESLRRPFLESLTLHVGTVALIVLLGLSHLAKREPWGSPDSMGGGAVGVTSVKSLPFLNRSGPTNRLASDTESQVPEPVTKPEPKNKTAPKESDDAIALKSKHIRKYARDSYRNPRVNPEPLADNQLTSRVGPAAASPLFAPAPGAGNVGVGSGAPFGNIFGAYAMLVRDRVAQKWRTDTLDSRIRTLPTTIITFEIQRNGQVRNVRVAQSSGNMVLDYSAQRAVAEAAPFDSLPAAYSGSSATIEFWFTLKR
jgi:TonB family protein